MTPTDILAVIRDQANDDLFGLYEIIWSLNTRYPEVPEAQKVAASIPVLESLVDSSEIILFRSRWATSAHAPVSREEAMNLVRDPASWKPPSEIKGGEYLSFGAT